jgi:hypothetical protein
MTCNDEWWGATKGEFKVIPSSWTVKIRLALESNHQYELDDWTGAIVEDYVTPHSIKLGNRTYNFNFASGKGYKDSMYYLSSDGRYLIRVSNHWSGVTKCSTRTKVCHWIKSCWWTLRGVGATSRCHRDEDFIGGIISFSELEKI